ncbi:MAG TPA: SxtJ family membrane protein [Vicinamibacterales bacterium]|jgi:hypothetical protein|nr:SxtJ family membrane protein [Vicinamibacterales bacterium]
MNPSHDRAFKPSDRMLRQFAALWVLFFGAVAWRAFARQQVILAEVLAVAAVTVGPLGLVWPRLIKPIFVTWMMLAFPIGWTVSRIVLGALFYGLFTPLALVFRLRGRDELGLRPRPGPGSYWSPKPAMTDKLRYLRQY